MSNLVITIARSYGSGGRAVGKLLSEKMKIKYYDRNLIYLASAKSGMDAEFLSQHDEYVKKNFFEKLSGAFSPGDVPPESGKFSSRENIFRFQSKIIRELASKNDCVIIGRCANHILKNSGYNPVRVFVWAPEEQCIKTVMEKFSITKAEAVRTINDINKHRREYYKYYTGSDWDSAKNYDLCINTADHDFDSAAELIRRYAAITDNK
ncbi:MAG: cytidylate kinase-like family protein [Clostridia bacterium]|nr:cytidylate kinase-like family protein [Clostridia bacterium]